MQRHANKKTKAMGLAIGSFALTLVAVSADTEAQTIGGTGDWPLYSHDFANTNNNPAERDVSVSSAAFLRRAWETFNDDTQVFEPPPTGFVLESVLGLEFPNAVVGVVASPIIVDGTIYYVDVLGTLFARDAMSGEITDPNRHWTTTLVDPDFTASESPVLPELYYTAPVVTDTHVWIPGSVFGRLHAVKRVGGAEMDFDPGSPGIDPYQLAPDLSFSSILGDSVIVNTGTEEGDRDLFITGINVIVNDAVLQGEESGLLIALDITEPSAPVERWRTPTIGLSPVTGRPFGSGLSAGAGLAVDTERKLVFSGTGQNTTEPYPGYPDPSLAPAGYVDRSDSLYAVNYLTGEFIWNNQFHNGDVFNLNAPVSTGPNRPDGPRDADVLSPPVLFSTVIDDDGAPRDLVGVGSKGGLFRVADRVSGETVWERQISQPTGIGGIQAGASVADGSIFVAGFEGIDDGFSDAQFGVSLESGLFANAFFATFSPQFWADVEDTADDDDPATGMRIKVFSLDAATGASNWDFGNGVDYVELRAGAALRHVSTANGLVFVTTTSGMLFVLDAKDGGVLFTDQTLDLNDVFQLGLGKPQHASMNGGTVISNGMLYVPYGAQNNPSGGLIAYDINEAPAAGDDIAITVEGNAVQIFPIDNDFDTTADALRFVVVAGQSINTSDRNADLISRRNGTIEVFNPGDDPAAVDAAYLKFTPRRNFVGRVTINYTVEDVAPPRRLNGVQLSDESNDTHVPRTDSASIRAYSLSDGSKTGLRGFKEDLRDVSLLVGARLDVNRLNAVAYRDENGDLAFSIHISNAAKRRFFELTRRGMYRRQSRDSIANAME